MVQGVLGGGENPFSPHDFFSFLFSPIKIWKWNNAWTIWNMASIEGFTTSTERTWKATSYSRSLSPALPSTPTILSNVEEFSGSTDRLRFHWNFVKTAIGTIDWNFESNYHGILPYNLPSTRPFLTVVKQLRSAPHERFEGKMVTRGSWEVGKTHFPHMKKLWFRIFSWTVSDSTLIHVCRNLPRERSMEYGDVYIFSRHNCTFLVTFRKSWYPKSYAKWAKHLPEHPRTLK